MQLEVYFEHTSARFAFITAIVSKQTGMDCWPLVHIFHLSRMMVQSNKNHGFKLFSESLNKYLVQALNDLLDDPQGEYFIEDSQYTDIALNMIKYIPAKTRYVLLIGYLGLRNAISFQVFSGLYLQQRLQNFGQYFTENPVKIIHSS